MATLAEQVQGERMARIVLSMIAEPNDLTTGYILGRHGGVATLDLVESDHDVTGLGRADVSVVARAPASTDRARPDGARGRAEQHGFGTLIGGSGVARRTGRAGRPRPVCAVDTGRIVIPGDRTE